MIRSKRRAKLLAGIAAISLVAAACGGDDDDDAHRGHARRSPRPPSPPSPRAGPTRRPRPTAPRRRRRRPRRRAEETEPDTDGERRRRPGDIPESRASATSRTTRASRSRAARCATASTPTPPTRGRRTGRATRPAATSRCGASRTRCSPSTQRASRCRSLARERRAQRRLHRVDADREGRHHVPRRHAARRRGRQVQHRRQPARRRSPPARYGRSATSTAEGQTVTITTRRPVGRPAVLPHRRCHRLHDVAAVAGQPARRAPAQRGVAGLRRRAGGDARRRRPGRAGRARGVRLRVLHARQRQRRSAPCATRTTGGARTASPARTCRTSTPSRPWCSSTPRAARTRLRSGEFQAMHTANADYVNQYLDDDEFELTSGQPLRRDGLHPDQQHGRPGARSRGQERRRARCSTSTAAGPWPMPSTTSASPRSGAPGSRCRPTARSRPARSATSRTAATRPTTPTPPSSRWTCACPSSARSPSSSRSTRRTTRSTSRANTLIISMWNEVFGDQVQATITPIEQGPYIGLALTGAFQAQGWRQHGSSDPDQRAAVVAERQRRPDRRPVAQLRPAAGRRHRREPDHHQDQPRPGRPPGGGRGRSTAASASRCTTCGTCGRCGASRRCRTVNGVELNILPDGSEGIGLAGAGAPPGHPDLVRRRRLRVKSSRWRCAGDEVPEPRTRGRSRRSPPWPSSWSAASPAHPSVWTCWCRSPSSSSGRRW